LSAGAEWSGCPWRCPERAQHCGSLPSQAGPGSLLQPLLPQNQGDRWPVFTSEPFEGVQAPGAGPGKLWLHRRLLSFHCVPKMDMLACL
jgi:hypothetical protein